MKRRRPPRAAPIGEPQDVQFEAAAFGGDAVGHLADGRVVFAPRLLPGEHASVRVVDDRKDFARAELAQLHVAAAGRTEPPCPYFTGGCGGCSWQHADYPLQLQIKRDVVVEQLRRIGRFAEADNLVRPPIGMVDPWHYRNQARFTVGRRFGELCFTLKSTHRLLRIDHCWIVHPAINATLEVLQGKLAGVERHIHQVGIRVGANTGQVIVDPALPEVPEVESGQTYLEEELLGTRFRLHPSSFFQVNTRREQRPLPDELPRALLPIPEDGLSMAELLALVVLDRVDPRRDHLVVDAYSGVGTFALLMAPLVREVAGIEEARTAVQDAQHNGGHMPNVRFVAGKTEDVLGTLAFSRRPDAVVLDPARVGCHPAVLDTLLGEALRPPKLVYVSCDPATLARDLRILVDGGYVLQDVQPLDMFPQTHHIECVATLTL
ncbi:MAG: class I SAM-dependent RNA methyltransferase [Chloroflexi bacterium]|nr:class I SAM-dependent RNA methyltransferase [Chloroflexota bacterium]